MLEDIEFIRDSFGLPATDTAFDSEGLPLFLKSSAHFYRCEALGLFFVVAQPKYKSSLPELKRLYAQTIRYCEEPVALSYRHMDARQCKALVRQSIPFICAKKQAFLPFLGFIAYRNAQSDSRTGKRKLSPLAQAILCWSLANQEEFVLSDIETNLQSSPGSTSKAVSELEHAGIVAKNKRGRTVVIRSESLDDALESHMEKLSDPVSKSMFVEKTALTDALPDAGETALAKRTSIAPPRVACKAISQRNYRKDDFHEILDGSLPDEQIVELQVWSYNPLCSRNERIDDVSLALSLSGNRDERVQSEVDSLFEKEYQWQKAR